MIAIRATYTMRNFKESIDKMLEIGGCCDEIWIAVYFHRPIEAHEKIVNELRPIVKDLKEKGIRVVFENGTNLGHGSDPCPIPELEDVEKMVGANGYRCTGAFCPSGKKFLEYQSRVMRMYASLEPYGIYLDDDFRLDWHGNANYGCFCEDCVAEYNAKHNTAYSGLEIAEKMLTDIDVRNDYINMMREHMAIYTRTLSEAAVDVCPDVYVGWEYVFLSAYNGDDFNFVFDEIYKVTGKSPLSRPGCFFYYDHHPRGVFDKILNTSWQNSILPEYVTVRRSEIENTTHTVMGKSVGGTCVESTLNLAYGCNSLSYSMCSSGNEPLETRSVMWQAFHDHRNYWQSLIDDQVSPNGEKTGVAGLRLPYFKDAWKAVVAGDTVGEFKWALPKKEAGRKLIEIGLPLTYEDDYSGAYLLHPDMVDYLSNEDIELLLSGNVYTDGMAVKKLIERGYGSALPFTVNESSAYYEVYTDHPANGKCAGEEAGIDGYVGGKNYQTFNVEDGCTVLANAMHSKAVSSLLAKTSFGGTWIADGCSLWSIIITGSRRSRISIAAQYLSHGKLPARLDSDDQIALIVRAQKDGTFKAATLLNMTIGNSYPPKIAIKASRDTKFVFARPGLEDVECVSNFVDGEHFVELPVLVAWQTGTIRVKS